VVVHAAFLHGVYGWPGSAGRYLSDHLDKTRTAVKDGFMCAFTPALTPLNLALNLDYCICGRFSESDGGAA